MYRNNDFPILPIGRVNMLNGKNAEYGSVWNVWEESTDDTFVLVKLVNWAGETLYRAIITADPIEHARGSYKTGERMGLVHDQTGARFSQGEWIICGLFPNTKEGLRQMALATGKKSIPFATFK